MPENEALNAQFYAGVDAARAAAAAGKPALQAAEQAVEMTPEPKEEEEPEEETPEGSDESEPETEPEPEQEPEAEKPADDADEEKGKDAGAETEPEPDQSMGPLLWDPDRQKRDQEHANRVKQLEAELAEERARKPGAEKPGAGEPTAVDVVDLEKEVEALAKNDDVTAEDIAKVNRKVVAALKAVTSGGTLRAELESLKRELQETKKQTEVDNRTSAEAQAQKQFDDMLAGLDKQYGARLHNDAYREVQKWLKDKGYNSTNNRPTLHLLESRFELVYGRLAKEHPAPGKRKEPGKRPPRAETGKGGASIPEVKAGDIDSVARQMLRAGRFDFGKKR